MEKSIHGRHAIFRWCQVNSRADQDAFSSADGRGPLIEGRAEFEYEISDRRCSSKDCLDNGACLGVIAKSRRKITNGGEGRRHAGSALEAIIE